MIKLLLTAIFLMFLCYMFKPKNQIHMNTGVSVSRPPWCPVTADDCSAHMREKVDKSILGYLNTIEENESEYNLNEQYVLENIDVPNDSVEHELEFIRVFNIQFKSHVPHIQLALRLGEPLSKYVKLNNERSLVQGI